MRLVDNETQISKTKCMT